MRVLVRITLSEPWVTTVARPDEVTVADADALEPQSESDGSGMDDVGLGELDATSGPQLDEDGIALDDVTGAEKVASFYMKRWKNKSLLK